MKDCDLRPVCVEFDQYIQGHDRANEQKSPCRRCKQIKPKSESEYRVGDIIKFKYGDKDKSILIVDKKFSQAGRKWLYFFEPVLNIGEVGVNYPQRYYGYYADISSMTENK